MGYYKSGPSFGSGGRTNVNVTSGSIYYTGKALEDWVRRHPEQGAKVYPEIAAKLGITTAKQDYEKAVAEANAANEARYQEGMGVHDEISDMFRPGSAYGAGAEALYERGKTKAIARGEQGMVSGGTYNTTVRSALGKKYEEEVGTPFRLQLNDQRMRALAGALGGKAGYIERKDENVPDLGLFADLYRQAGSAYGNTGSSSFPPGSSGSTNSGDMFVAGNELGPLPGTGGTIPSGGYNTANRPVPAKYNDPEWWRKTYGWN